MKSLLLVCFIFFSVGSNGWLTDFEQARQEARRSNALILLNFSGSDWCGPCIQLKKNVFEKPEFENYAAEHLVLVRADFPRQKKNQLSPQQKAHNEKLADQYNPDGKFPLTVLLDAEGKVIYEWEGFTDMTAAAFVEQLQAKASGK